MKKIFAIFITLGAVTLNATAQSSSFTELSVSKNDTQKAAMRVSESLTSVNKEGVKKKFPLKYRIILHSGDMLNEQMFARVMDKNSKPIIMDDGSVFISNNPDSNSVLKAGGKNYLITHFEEEPGQLYKTELVIKNNSVVPKSTQAVNLEEIHGTITNCAGSKTAWNTHLGGEEDYSLNSRYADKTSPFYIECAKDKNNLFTRKNSVGIPKEFCVYVSSMQKYLKDEQINVDGYNGKVFTPYNYGYIIELHIKDNGSTEFARHYVTGKYTPELAIHMPDKKTFYMSDDGNAKGLYKFVSDKPITQFSKNWSGTLYSAKLKQLSAKNGGSFSVNWVKLGSSSDNELQKLIESKIKLTDIFNIKKDTKGRCGKNYTKIYEDGDVECLALKLDSKRSNRFKNNDEVKTAAVFLETRKYSAYLGGTIEFNKEEGLTYDKENNVVYLAITQIANSMENDFLNKEAGNDIRLEKNICGAVYSLALDSNYSAVSMSPLVVGKPLKSTEEYSDEYTCHPESIANPDNISYLSPNKLLIGEDTTLHVNNYVWVYNTKNKTMTRIASLPIGAEVTGLTLMDAGNKKSILLNIQHPFEDNPKNAKGQTPNSFILQKADRNDKRGVVGYIDGLPSNFFK